MIKTFMDFFPGLCRIGGRGKKDWREWCYEKIFMNYLEETIVKELEIAKEVLYGISQ